MLGGFGDLVFLCKLRALRRGASPGAPLGAPWAAALAREHGRSHPGGRGRRTRFGSSVSAVPTLAGPHLFAATLSSILGGRHSDLLGLGLIRVLLTLRGLALILLLIIKEWGLRLGAFDGQYIQQAITCDLTGHHQNLLQVWGCRCLAQLCRLGGKAQAQAAQSRSVLG